MRVARLSAPSILALTLLLAGGSLGPAPQATGQDAAALVAVVNKANSSVKLLSRSDAKKILLGQTPTWPDGLKVKVALTKAHTPGHTLVLDKIGGMNEADFTRYEMRLLFEGLPATEIHEQPSSAAVRAFVEANPGAIGFVHAADAGKDLKVVLTVP